MNKTEGEIQFIKPDRKSLTINGIWYNSYLPIDIKYKKGDNVVIDFSTKDNFSNIKKIDYSNKGKLLIKEFKELKSTNEIKTFIEITNQTINTILINAREIYTNVKTITIEESTDLAIRSYKRLLEKI